MALYPNGAQGASPPLAASADPVQPLAVTAAPTPARNVTLSWGAMAGANSYQVHRKLAGQAAFQFLAVVGNATTTWTDGTVLPPGQHQYFVQAANGLPSAPMTVTLPPVAAPANLTVQDFLGAARLTWDRVPGATGYHVFRMLLSEPGFSRPTTDPVIALTNTATQFFPGPQYTDQHMPKAQQVRYYVQAVDGAPSALVTVVIGIPRWSQIRKFPGSNSIYMNWSGDASPTSVQVLRAGTPTGPFMFIPGVDYFNGEAHVHGNTLDVVQYFKLQATYPTGMTESVVIQVMIKSGQKETCFGSVNARGAVTWQNYEC